MASDNIVTVTNDNFGSTVEASDLPILVDFWAVWCGPCRMVAPHLEAIAAEMGDKVRIGKVDVDSNQDLAARFQVSSIPTLILFKDGAVADRMVGALPKAALESFVNRNL
jgi:thioredoxin